MKVFLVAIFIFFFAVPDIKTEIYVLDKIEVINFELNL